MLGFIHFYEVDPTQQQRVFRLLWQFYEEVVNHFPGFVRAKLMQGHSGAQVVVVSRWRNELDYEGLANSPQYRELHALLGQLVEAERIDYYEDVVAVQPARAHNDQETEYSVNLTTF